MTIDLNPSAFKRDKAVKQIHAAIDEALVAGAMNNKRRNYLGASAIGAPCERKVQYEFMKQAKDADWRPSPRTQRIFARGHIAEEMAIKWLTDAGYALSVANEAGFQFGFKSANGKFSGHCDGIIQSGPYIEAPCLWEHKALGSKSWRAIDKHGLAKAKPEYADQLAIYQAYMGLTEPALFQATNMDTMEIYFELVKFDKKRAQAASDRAVSIIQDSEAGALRPRVSDDPNFWLCQNKSGKCEFLGACHD